MRIAFVSPEFVTESNYDGGLANYLHRVCLALVDMGHEPHVFVAADRDETLNYAGIKVWRVNTALAKHRVQQVEGMPRLSGMPRRPRRPRLLRMLRLSRLSPLLYGVQLMRTSWLVNRRLRAAHCQTPYDLAQFTHLGGIGLFRPRGLPAVVRMSSYTPLVNEAVGMPRGRLGGQQHELEMAAMRRADAVFSPSRMIAEVVRRNHRVPVTVIESPFFLDTAQWDDTLLHRLGSEPYILYFGTLNVLKGLQEIAAVAQRVLDENPGLRLVLAGKEGAPPGEPSLSDVVRQQAGEHGGRVVYLGPARHAQLYPVVANARAVVLPSRIDNFPNTCIEAMAFGRTVIGTLGTSFEQLIVHGQSGLLCERRNPESLLAAIRAALAMPPAEQEEMGRRARQRIEELRPEKVVRQLLEFHAEIIARTDHGHMGRQASHSAEQQTQ